MSIRIAYNLFTQHPKQEYYDFAKWTEIVSPGKGNDTYKLNGAGEMLAFSAADFEDFLEPRPELVPVMEAELKKVVGLLVEKRWPFRLHATYDESISRFLDVFEGINREIPFNGLRWFFDHAETISEKNMERVHRLGGGIAIQDRMAFQGEYFVDRYGVEAAKMTPPITKMLRMGIPVGAGTDATRVSSYNPWVSLYWLVSGKTVGGLSLYDENNRLDRTSALRLYTEGSSWFSGDAGKKGRIVAGQLADLAVLSADYFAVPVALAAVPVFASDHKVQDNYEKHESARSESKLYGTVQKIPANRIGLWMVNGREIFVTRDTRIKEEYGKAVTGAYVEVEGTNSGKVFTANKIEVKSAKK